MNAGSVFAYTNWRIKWNGLYNVDPKAIFVPAGPIKGDAGKAFHFTPSTLSGWTITMVGKSTKHEARIAKMLEYFSEDEKSIESTYGPKGIAWDYDSDGHVKFSDEREKDFAADPTAANLKYEGIGWFTNWIPIQSTFPKPTNEVDKWKAETEKHFSAYSYNTLPFEAIKPGGGTDEAAIDVKIEEYRKSMGAKMVLAKSEAEVEQIFNDMVAQEEKLGYNKLYTYWDTHFKEAKKKLGVEFAWPDNQK
ncbi:hypothetical protein [Paenibacillus mendelii]|uniref:ABC transporter substrate-binding protein n=1 Tax=Paenibacillus mendelii TaxID=206163 RepID=A0ABV6JB03_9BACL|nr:hypothetical protein [Paenibacillus mendelii]MCQ6562949.1 hypothetical protein [Paenibacillus mendelii]